MRVYTTPFEANAISAGGNKNLFEILAGSANPIEIIGWEITSSSIVAEALDMRLLRASTGGTGGTAAPENPTDPAQQAATAVVLVDTVPGTDGAVLETFNWEQLGPLGQVYVPEAYYKVPADGRIVLNMVTVPTAFTLNGYVKWIEA